MKRFFRLALVAFLVCRGLDLATPPNPPWFPQAPQMVAANNLLSDAVVLVTSENPRQTIG